MLMTRTFSQRRIALLGVAGAALVLCSFLAMPEGRAYAASLLLFFRGQVISPVTTTSADLHSAYQTLEDLEKLGTLQGTVPASLQTVADASAARSVARFTFNLAQPTTLPNGFNKTASSARASAPTTVTLTLHAAQANAYFQSIGSSQKLPAQLEGEQIVVNFPGVTVLEYSNPAGGSVYVGQAGQLSVQISGNATADQLRTYLLTLPGLSSSTVNSLKSITNWQATIPLGIPTDKAGWKSYTVGGSFGGNGVILNDNTGIASAILWQHTSPTATTAATSGTQSLGVGGKGLTADQVQAIANSLQSPTP